MFADNTSAQNTVKAAADLLDIPWTVRFLMFSRCKLENRTVRGLPDRSAPAINNCLSCTVFTQLYNIIVNFKNHVVKIQPAQSIPLQTLRYCTPPDSTQPRPSNGCTQPMTISDTEIETYTRYFDNPTTKYSVY